MRGKRIFFDAITAYSVYAKARITDRLPQKDAYMAAAEATGINVGTLKVRAHRERWETKLGDYLMPCLQAMVPTTTTAQPVLDAERKAWLEVAQQGRKQCEEGMKLASIQLQVMKKMKKFKEAQQWVGLMNSLALIATRYQAVGSHATCDSGSSLAPDTSGAPLTQPLYKIVFPKESSQPRIPQPLPKSLELTPPAV